MSTLEKDLLRSAERVAQALSQSGYVADFSPASLAEIDRFFDEQTVAAGQVRPGSLLSNELGARLFGLGGYVGEVVRRAQGGAWLCDESDPDAEMNVRLQTGDFVCLPVQRVIKRFRLGCEAELVAWGAGLGVQPD